MIIDSENNLFVYNNESYPLFGNTDIDSIEMQHHIDVASETITEMISKITKDDNETIIES